MVVKKLIVVFSILLCHVMSGMSKCSPNKNIWRHTEEYVVDIYNYFGKEGVDSSLEEIYFFNQDTTLILRQMPNGDFSCDNLADNIVMYYPYNYNLIVMLCDTLRSQKGLNVYIHGVRYTVSPQKQYAIYSITEFLTKYVYLLLQPQDTLKLDKKVVTLNKKCMYEIVDVKEDNLMIREVLYDESNIPRITSLPDSLIYMYRWRDGSTLHTQRFVIDE